MGSPSPSQRQPDRLPSGYTLLASFINENQVLKGFTMVPVSNSIYIIGGRKCHKIASTLDGSGNEAVEEDLEVVRNVWRYNMGDATWEECASLTVPRFDFACNAVGDKIYVAGGQCTVDDVRGVSCAEVYDSKY